MKNIDIEIDLLLREIGTSQAHRLLKIIEAAHEEAAGTIATLAARIEVLEKALRKAKHVWEAIGEEEGGFSNDPYEFASDFAKWVIVEIRTALKAGGDTGE